MKKQFKYLPLIALMAFAAASCNEEEAGGAAGGGEVIITDSLIQGVYTEEVSNITVNESKQRTLEVAWSAPADASRLAYYLVEYQGVNDVDTTVYRQISNDTKYAISKLYNTTYRVKVYCVSDKMEISSGVAFDRNVTPQPDHQAPGEVQNLVIEVGSKAANIVWDNPSDDDYENLDITVTTKNAAGQDSIVGTTSLLSIDNELILDTLSVNTKYELNFVASDYIGNVSDPVVKSFQTMDEVPVDKKYGTDKIQWEVIAWSSEENDGKAVNAIDDNDNTIWHSRWRSAAPKPDWIIIDFGEGHEHAVATVHYYKRNNTTGSCSLVRLDAAKVMAPDVNDSDWVEIGTATVKDPYSPEVQDLSATKVYPARYLRFVSLASKNGHAMVRNLKISEFKEGSAE